MLKLTKTIVSQAIGLKCRPYFVTSSLEAIGKKEFLEYIRPNKRRHYEEFV